MPTRKTVIVFGKDGRIVHVHQALALPGAELPDESELEADALEIAGRKAAGDKHNLQVLHADSDALKPGMGYRVDVAKKALIEVPRASK